MPTRQNNVLGHTNSRKPYHTKNHVEKTDTLIYALGGLGEVGKNMYCYEHENEICIVRLAVFYFLVMSFWVSIMSFLTITNIWIRMEQKKEIF